LLINNINNIFLTFYPAGVLLAVIIIITIIIIIIIKVIQ